MTKVLKTNKDLKQLELSIGITFKSDALLNLAFVHKSFVNEDKQQDTCNERLEFLGDAVLELSVTDYLYRTYPENPEGELTNWRSALVKGKHLASVARRLGLGDYLRLSRGEDLSGGRDKDYILANTVEAFIGAIYLDQGYEKANQFVLQHIVIMLDEIIEQGLHIDAKSRVQELAQDKLNITPKYVLVSETGPDHSKNFVMGVKFGKRLAGEGEGLSKQAAEQAAAHDALVKEGWI